MEIEIPPNLKKIEELLKWYDFSQVQVVQEKKHKCQHQECLEYFPSEYERDDHMRLMHDIGTYKCSFNSCKGSFVHKYQRIRHYQKNHQLTPQ